MSAEVLRAALVDLGWSVFTEMGVPGVVRNHAGVVIDPEPAVVAVPAVAVLDPRLRDQVYLWCRAHGARLSVSRLQGLVRALPEPHRVRFHALAATLRANEELRWPSGDASCWARRPTGTTPALPVERPAMLRFRLRGVWGVGARADTMAELLAHGDRWARVSELVASGYSKRSVAAILAEWHEAGVVQQRSQGNAWTYRLVERGALDAWLGSSEGVFPSWTAVWAFALQSLELLRLEEAQPVSRRVAAHRLRSGLAVLAVELELPAPPETAGQPAAWDLLVSWAAEATAGPGTASATGVA